MNKMKIQVNKVLVTSLLLFHSVACSMTVTAASMIATDRYKRDELYPHERPSTYSNLEQAYNELKMIVSDLKGFIHDDYIEVLRFDTNRAELQQRVGNLRTFIESRRFPRLWYAEYEYASFFYDCMVEIAEAFKTGCEYWGSDIVESLGRISVRVLSFYRMEEEPLDMETHRKLARLEDKFNELQSRVSLEELISVLTLNTIKEYEKDVQKALDTVKQNIRFNKTWAGSIHCEVAYTRKGKILTEN